MVLLVEQLTELKAKMKLFAAELQILARTDARILLIKVDAALRETQQVGIDVQSQIHCLQLSKQELLLKLGGMVPVSELHSSQAEARKLREDNKALNQLLQQSRVDIDDLQCSIQVSDSLTERNCKLTSHFISMQFYFSLQICCGAESVQTVDCN